MNNSFARGTKTASNSTFSMTGSRYLGASSMSVDDPLAQSMYRPPPIESSHDSFASKLALLKEERSYTASEREEYGNNQDQGDIPSMPPARTVDEFLQAEAAQQEAILVQELSESQREGLGQIPLGPDESGLLAPESWPRVDPDMTQHTDDPFATSSMPSRTPKLSGVIPNGPKELELLADYISKIASTLRISSQSDQISLITDSVSQEILNERALQARMSQLGLDKKSSSKGTGSDPVTNGETSGTFMTDVPSLRGGKSHWARTASSPPDSSKGQLDGRGLYNSTVVESAFFPGMESADLNLPNETRPKEIVDLVFKTWDLPARVKSNWRKILHAKPTLSLIRDGFWFIWHTEFSPTSTSTQTALLDRIAATYVNLFMTCTYMYKDTFFSALPSILSQSVFESFMAAFPKSQKHFEGAFKTAICDAFAKWMTGIVPTDPYWGSWIDPGSVVKKSLVAAAPQPPVGDIKRRASAAPQPIPTLAPHNKKDEALDVLSGALRDVSKKPIDLTPPPSCRIGPGPKVIRRPFDVYQNSPAVIQYMTLQGSRNNHCKITVHRSETVREPLKSTPSSSSVQSLPTYREILDASAESTKAALQSYHARIKNVQKERAALTKEIAATLAREKLKASFILARPELVKEKADKVVQGMHEQTKRRKEALLAKTRGQKIVFN